jgi:hypothetical protein
MSELQGNIHSSAIYYIKNYDIQGPSNVFLIVYLLHF